MYVVAQNLNSSDPEVHAALAAGDRRWLEERARTLAARGCDALDVNAGSFASSEFEVLNWALEVVEAVVDLPLAVDSADLQVLARAATGRRHAPLLNSVDLVALESLDDGPLGALVDREGSLLVVQLRRGAELPDSADLRLRWAERAVELLARRSIDPTRVLLDAVMLPWGGDLGAGRGLLDFVAEAGRRWPSLRTLVGLSNVSYGHGEPRALHEQWLRVLKERGLGAVLLDALDPTVLHIARS